MNRIVKRITTGNVFSVSRKLFSTSTISEDVTPVNLFTQDYPANRTSTIQQKPLIVIHGLMGHSNNWRNVVSKTAMTENRQVICVDLRNHGSSPHSDSFSYEALANDIALVMDQKGIDKADLLGHSLGGKVAMAFALSHGRRVHNLVVADIAPLSYESTNEDMRGVENILQTVCQTDLSNHASRKDIDAQLARGVPEVGVRQFLLTNLAAVDKNAPNPTNADLYWKPNIHTLLAKYDSVRGFDMPPYAEKFFGPTLFLRGGRSTFVDPTTIENIAEPYFGNISVQTIEGAGHWLHAEKPNEFIQKVTKFLLDHQN